MMLLIGLTGSIAMGKSTVASMLVCKGIPVLDIDACVHELMRTDQAAISQVGSLFPQARVRTRDGWKIDRKILASFVFSFQEGQADRREEKLAGLEGIIHPMVYRQAQKFLLDHQRKGCRYAALDIPLLFETGADKLVDVVFLVSAPRLIQLHRVMRRPGMTRERLSLIESRQMQDHRKRRRADVLIPAGLGKAVTFRILCRAVDNLGKTAAKVFPCKWHKEFSHLF